MNLYMKKSGIFTVQTPFQNTQNNLKDILICTLGYFHSAPLSYTKKTFRSFTLVRLEGLEPPRSRTRT